MTGTALSLSTLLGQVSSDCPAGCECGHRPAFANPKLSESGSQVFEQSAHWGLRAERAGAGTLWRCDPHGSRRAGRHTGLTVLPRAGWVCAHEAGARAALHVWCGGTGTSLCLGRANQVSDINWEPGKCEYGAGESHVCLLPPCGGHESCWGPTNWLKSPLWVTCLHGRQASFDSVCHTGLAESPGH